MNRFWSWWLERCGRDMDARPLAIVRILVALCIVGDILYHSALGLADDLWRPYAFGGLSQVQDRAWILDDILGGGVAGPVALVVTVVCFTLVALGVKVRWAIVIGALAYAQLGHGYPPGDRAIDRILRTAMLVLLFSQSHRRFALGGGPRLERIPAFPAQILTWLLVMIYLSAGVSKLISNPRWLAIDGTPVLYRLMTDPLASFVDPVWAESLAPLWFLGSWATIVVELSVVLLLTRWGPIWSLFAMWIHIGILFTMKLGMFSLGMLAFYPLLLAPFLLPLLDRIPATRNAAA